MGVVTSAVSPFDLPISARAMGEEIEILPSRTLASLSPTILYFTFSSVSSSTSVTVAPNFTVVPDSFEVSMTSARLMLSSMSATRASLKPWAPWPHGTRRSRRGRRGRAHPRSPG